jgi:hypothetical protein
MAERVPVLACAAVAALLDGPAVPARVLGAGRHAVYLKVPGGVVAVVGPDAVRLPNAVVCPAPPPAPQRASVGDGAVRLDDTTLVVRRWWDPVPRLGTPAHGVLAAAVDRLASLLPAWPPPTDAAAALARGRAALAAALAATRAPGGSAAAIDVAVVGLVGLGPGLTPAGDDLLAGTVAGLVLLGRALGRAGDAAVATGHRVGAAAARAAAGTTALSADLTRHAGAGAVALPAAAVCRALAGYGDLRHALAGLLAVGHTSGADLAQGLLLGATAALAAVVAQPAATADLPPAVEVGR